MFLKKNVEENLKIKKPNPEIFVTKICENLNLENKLEKAA